MALSKRTYFGLKRGLVITLLVALNASSLPIAIRAFEAPEEAGAAENVVFNINVDLNPQRGPLLDCGGGTFCNPADQWDGPGRLAPEEVMSNLKQGQIVRIHSITGDVEWGGGDGYQNPASCKDSPHPILAGTPKHLVVFQFTDNQNRVVPAGVPTPNGTNAIPARDFIGQGIPVPAGATKMFASYPDSRYNDNHQRCHIQGVLVETVPDPTPPPTTPPPPPGACTPQNATFVSQKVIRADNASHAGSSPVNGTRLPAGTYLVEYRDGEWSAWGTDDDPLAKGLPWLGHVNVAYQTNAGLAQTTAGANGAFLTAAEAKAAGKDKFVTVSISDSGTDNLFVYFRDDHIPDNRNQVRYGIYRCDEPTVPTPPPTGACTPQNATFMYDKVIRAVNTDHAGSTPVNGTRLPVGTYLVEYRDGEWSAWGRDDDPLANGLPWLGYVDVAHLTNGGLVHTLAGAGGAFLTPAEAKAAGKGKFVTVTVDASTSENLFVYFKDHFVDDNRNQIRYALYRCDELSPAPTVQLQIEKTAPETVKTGETAVFTIKVTNIGQIPAENFFVWDPLPNNIFAFDPSKSDSSCRGEPNRVVCENLSLQKGQSKTLKIAMKIPETFTCPLNMHNIAYTAKENEPSYNAQTPLVPFRVECGPKPVLKIEKTGPATALRGSNISYNVKVTNQGDGVARDVVAIDRVPQGFEFVSSGTSSECSFETDNVGPLVACRYSSLSAGSSRTAKIVFKASDAIACGATVMNQADVLFNTDTIADWSKVMTVIECPPKPDVDVEKTGPATVRPGENVVYKVKLTNNGPGAAQNLSVIDRVPAGLTFTSQGTSPACVLGADQAGQLVECTLSNLNASSSHTFTIVFTARNDLQCGATIVNQATVQGANIDPASSTAQVLIDCPKADLEINKTGPATVTAGSVVKYQLTVKNLGNDDATNVVVADPIPTGVTFNAAQSSNGCVQNGANILCDNLTLSSGQSKTFTVAFDVPAVAQCDSILINRASVSGSQTDPNPSNNQSQVVTTKVECEKADLSIEKTGDASVRPGNVIVYSVTVRNAGPATAQNVIVTDPIPAGLTFRAGQSSGSCVQQGVNVVCSTSSLGSNQSATFKFAFDVPASAQCDAFIQNVAGVSSSTLDPQPGNNQSQTVSTLIDCPKADLEINKTGPATVTAGSVVKYQLTVKNLGNDDATNVVVADPIPTGVTFNAAQSSAGCVQNGANILCDNLTLSSGQSKTFTVAFDVPSVAQCDSILINRASVSGSQTDPNPSNNQSQVVTTKVECEKADLSIEKTGDASVRPGNVIVYSVTVRNAGPATAQNVVVTDPIPAGLTFRAQQSSNACVQQGVNVVCSTASLGANQSATFKLAFDVPGHAQCDAFIQNVAGVSSSTLDPQPGNNQSQTVSTLIDCPKADLEINKTGPATVTAGSVVKYQLTVKNLGNDDATNVVVADPIPTGVTFNAAQSSNGCVQNGANILCDNLTLSSGQSKTFTVAFDVPSVAQCDSILINRASVSGSQTDPNPSNNQSQVVTTSVQCLPVDLSIVKQGPATVAPGAGISYTLTVKNDGPADAANVIVTDRIPSGLTFNPAQSDNRCTQQGPDVVCAIPSLTKNASATLTLSFHVSPQQQCSSTIVNRAEVWAANQTDANQQNNVSQNVSTQVKCPEVDVSITKSGPATVMKGGTVAYTLTASNAGPDTASNVIISDPIPAGLTFNPVQSGAGCIQNGGVIECAIAGLASGQSKSVTLVFNVPQSVQCSSVLYNTASVSSSELDRDHTNNQSTVVSTLVQCPTPKQADLSIIKKGPATAVPGGLAVYTLHVTNLGPDTATGVTVTDQIPAGVTFNATFSDASCTQNAGTVTCGGFTLAKNQTRIVTVAFAVPFTAQCGGFIHNAATVSGAQQDPSPFNNQSQTVTTTIQCPKADLSITKSGPATVTQSGTIIYTLVASNAGPGSASGVLVTDQIPSGLTFDASQSDGLCVQQGFTVACGPFTLASGTSRTLKLAFDVPSSAQCASSFHNVAEISGNQNDPSPSNNTSTTVKTTVQCDQEEQADVSIVKSGPQSVLRGGVIVYTLTASNSGPSTAEGVRFIDHIPAGLTFHPGQSDATCSQQSASIVCGTFTLPSGQSKSVSVAFTVPSSAQCNATIRNDASVTAFTLDPYHANNDAYAQTQVDCPAAPQADVSISKSGPAQITRGQNITYVVTASNNGPATATGVVVKDVVPAGLTFVPAQSDATCAVQGAEIVCQPVTLNPSQFKSFSLTFATSGQQVSCGGTLSNTASVTTGTHDPNTSNNQSQTIATTVQCPTPTFSITKSDSRTTAAPGDALSYVITVTNTSSVQATNVTVTDTLPSQVTFVSATDGGTHLNQVVTWTGVTLAPGGTRTLTVNVTVNQSATNGTVLTNTAQVGGNGPSATDTTTVQTAQQFGCIEILKETFDTNNNVITPVAQFTFTLDGTRSVQNDSLGKARFESVPVGSHIVTETLPSSWTQVSVTPTGGNVTVNAGSSCATVVFKNRQTLTAGGTPTFTITKTDGRSDVRPGETLTYSITVTNTSSVQATNVTVTDILPSLVTYVSASDSPSVNGGVITWSNLTIAAGASRTFTVTATVQNVSQTTVLTNIAQVQNQTATDTTTVIRDTQPPVHPPVYPPVYPPVQPPVYPPVQPPHYPPVQPPIGKPYPYPIPQTGDNVASGLYVTDENGEQYLTAENAPESRSLATYIAIFATTIASAVTAAGTMIVKFI